MTENALIKSISEKKRKKQMKINQSNGMIALVHRNILHYNLHGFSSSVMTHQLSLTISMSPYSVF